MSCWLSGRCGILNIHASLLPAFSGRNPTQQALEFGAQVTGCTAYFVEELGTYGPIIVPTGPSPLKMAMRSAMSSRDFFPSSRPAMSKRSAELRAASMAVRGKRYVRVEPSVEEVAEELPAYAPEP